MITMQSLRHTPPHVVFYAIIMVAVAFVCAATPLEGFDPWWHLKSGEIIWLWKTIPRYDLFSYTAFGQAWVNPEWLSQVIMWLTYRAGDVDGLIVLKVILALGITTCVYRGARMLVENRIASLWVTLFVMVLIHDRIMLRPYLFSELLTAYFLWELYAYAAGRRRWLWHLPLLTVLWINLHGGGILAPMLIGAFFIGERAQELLKGPSPIEHRRIQHGLLILVLSIMACFINPWTEQVVMLPFEHLGMNTILTHTSEWMPAGDPRLDSIISVMAYRILLPVIMLSFILNRRQARLAHLFLMALGAYMAMNHHRFLPTFFICSVPILFFNLRSRARGIRLSPQSGHLRSWTNLAIMMLIVLVALEFGLPMTLEGRARSRVGRGVVSKFAPEGAVMFIRNNGISGRIFNEMAIGGYIIFRLWPRTRVFIDGRTPLYGDDFYKRYIGIFHAVRNFKRIQRDLRFDAIVLSTTKAWDLRQFHAYLWKQPEWKLVYFSPFAMVYVQDVPPYREVIEKYEWKKHPVIEEMKRADG